MKKIIFLLLALALAIPVFPQEKQSTEKKSNDDLQMKTLFGNQEHKHNISLGYFFEMSAGYTQFGTKDVFLPGFNFGMILNHHWTIGMAGSFVANTNYLHFQNIYFDYATQQMTEARLGGEYGGLLLEYTLMPRSVVHVSFPLIIGGGYMAYYANNLSYTSGMPFDHNNHKAINDDYFLVVEPGIKAEFNFLKMLRVGVGVSYRYTPDLKLVNTSTQLINQFNAKLSMRLGKF